MIRIDCEQGSPEWFRARCGIPTASNFKRIITPSGKPTGKSTQERYMAELIAERCLGPLNMDSRSSWMERGNDLEADGVLYYEALRDVDCEKVGFFKHDTLDVGCSPDRIVRNSGGLTLSGFGGVEIKAPSPAIHVMRLIGFEEFSAKQQVQGTMWIMEAPWWDLLSYHPDMGRAPVRFERDEEYIAAIDAAVRGFLDRLADAATLAEAAGLDLSGAELLTPCEL